MGAALDDLEIAHCLAFWLGFASLVIWVFETLDWRGGM